MNAETRIREASPSMGLAFGPSARPVEMMPSATPDAEQELQTGILGVDLPERLRKHIQQCNRCGSKANLNALDIVECTERTRDALENDIDRKLRALATH